MENTKFYQKTWFIVLMLILFFPVGLILMWKFANWKKSAKIIVTAVFIILFIISVLTPDDDSGEQGTTQSQTTEIQTTTEPVTKSQDELSIDTIMTSGMLSREKAEMILKDLKSVGVEKVEDCHRKSDYDDYSCVLDDGKYSYVVNIINNKTDTIYCGEVLLFDASKGGTVDSVKNHEISFMKEVTFKAMSKKWVEKALKSPTTAEYHEKFEITRNKDIVTVQSSVDSQNTFGAMIRSDFVVQMTYSSEGEELVCLIIDNEVMYGRLVK